VITWRVETPLGVVRVSIDPKKEEAAAILYEGTEGAVRVVRFFVMAQAGANGRALGGFATPAELEAVMGRAISEVALSVTREP
jgi:hypothetical protein